MSGFRLSDQQWDIFDRLAQRDAASKASLIHACFGDRLDCDLPPSAGKIIDVQLHRLRRRLRDLGIAIVTEGKGESARYRMPPPSRALARDMVRARG